MNERDAARVLWLTGAPGVGKTTLIKRLAEAVANCSLGGFYTEEIRRDGAREGFRLANFRGDTAVMAHVEFPKRYRVGRYGVNVAAIDAIAGAALSAALPVDLYLIDEVGKMECMSEVFVHALRALLNEPTTVIGTISQAGGGLVAELKQRPGSTLWEVTRENRDGLPIDVLAWLDQDRVRYRRKLRTSYENESI